LNKSLPVGCISYEWITHIVETCIK